jgi:hypothetical protein
VYYKSPYVKCKQVAIGKLSLQDDEKGSDQDKKGYGVKLDRKNQEGPVLKGHINDQQGNEAVQKIA